MKFYYLQIIEDGLSVRIISERCRYLSQIFSEEGKYYQDWFPCLYPKHCCTKLSRKNNALEINIFTAIREVELWRYVKPTALDSFEIKELILLSHDILKEKKTTLGVLIILNIHGI